MTRARGRAAAAALALATLPGCTDGDSITEPDPDPGAVELAVSGFPPLAQAGGTFELWISFAEIRGGAPGARHATAASAGRFMVDEELRIVGADYQPAAFAVDPASELVPTTSDGTPAWTLAVDAFMTIEPEPDPDPEPNLPALLGGSFVNGTAVLSVTSVDALGRDFKDVEGSFVLATPTTTATGDEAEGVWFATPGGTAPGLVLPALPGRWMYEGWVSLNSAGSFSLGRFSAASGADDDGPGDPVPGQDAAGWAFPGSDFPTGVAGVDLRDGNVFVTLEPPGNADDADGNTPFFLELLVAPLPPGAATGTSLPLTNVASFPGATVTIPFEP